MSRHRNVKNLDIEDGLDDYDYSAEEEEDDLSPEDRAMMARGVAEVQAALGVEAGKVTVAQIEESLWYYYYDVEKTVNYLIKKYINPPAPKKKPPPPQQPNGEFATSVFAPGMPISPQPRQSLASLFWDMPWGNIPKHRETTFIPPHVPRGGLLGGSGAAPKMSKLQALAAARKKKAEEKKAGEKKAEERAAADVEQAQSKLKELSVNETTTTSSRGTASMAGAFGRRLKTAQSAAQGRVPLAANEPGLTGSSIPSLSTSATPSTLSLSEDNRPIDKAPQSSFAQTLFASPLEKDSSRKRKLPEYFALYPDLPQSVIDAFSKPSPDDIVLQAQAKAGKKNAAPAQPKKKSTATALSTKQASAAQVTDKVSELKISDAVLPKSRNLDVPAEYTKSQQKKSASFVVVGHVDSGKSTMMGRLLLDLKIVNERAVDKLRKEAEIIGKGSFALAWVMDSREDERAHGVTIDIAMNRFETERMSFLILDAPGHRDYIPNMIAGASQADFAILVIDAKEGNFEAGLRGQTYEHIILLRSMGVFRLIVAINKLDMVNWSRERFEEIKDQITGFFKRLGFQLDKIAFVPVSALKGDNIVNRSTDPAASWYAGRTLIQELEASDPKPRELRKPLRMIISEVYSTMQSPVTILGRLEQGCVQVGEKLLLLPANQMAYVKAINTNGGEPVDWAVAGQHAEIALDGIIQEYVSIGDVVCDPNHPVKVMKEFTMKALAWDMFWPMPVDVHRGRLHASGKVTKLVAVLDRATGAVTKKFPQAIRKGQVARIKVEVQDTVPLEAGQRVVLRRGGETVAAGLLE